MKMWISIGTLFLILQGVQSLRDVKIFVPEAVGLGQPAILECDFQLDGDALYMVKWYKGGREFYRYTPRERIPVKIFSTIGLNEPDIIKEKSNATQVHIKSATEGMSGHYSCEVSADAPSFHTLLASASMVVVDPPAGRPVITGLKGRYRAGDPISANCTSPNSRPAANLTWVINGKPVDHKHVRNYRKIIENDLETSISTIRLIARDWHFPDGTMKLKCTASFHNLYWQTTEKVSDLDKPRTYNAFSNDVLEKPPTKNDYIPPTHSLVDQGFSKINSTSGLDTISLHLNLVIVSIFLTTRSYWRNILSI